MRGEKFEIYVSMGCIVGNTLLIFTNSFVFASRTFLHYSYKNH
jgi:hypothetical protein